MIIKYASLCIFTDLANYQFPVASASLLSLADKMFSLSANYQFPVASGSLLSLADKMFPLSGNPSYMLQQINRV
jgi:hypothetical protein